MLQGKKGIIIGVANKRSIAWGVAESLHKHGAEIILTCQNERVAEKVKPLAEEALPGSKIHICDLSNDEEVKSVFAAIGKELGQIDYLVHSVAFANRDELGGEYLATSRDGFKLALDVSAYSLNVAVNAAREYMSGGGSVVAMTYLGSQRAVPGYNVMGVAKAALEAAVRYLANDLGKNNIRVNAISAGPVNTLAARGIANFTEMLKYAAEHAPLGRNTTPGEIGDACTFLVSDLARGITGDIIYVDNGLHITG